MDWKEILSRKVAEGELPIEDSTPAVEEENVKPSRDTLTVLIDRKGRKGKTATIVTGFTCDDETLKEVAARLKSQLATGGSARGGEILIQGDRCADIRAILKELGYKVR